MKILIYSDLHLEFGVGFEPPNCDADIAVLAGDIGKGVRATEWANQSFKCDVVQIAGNHEFYGGHIDRTWEKMRAVAAPHVHLLENQAFIYPGGSHSRMVLIDVACSSADNAYRYAGRDAHAK